MTPESKSPISTRNQPNHDSYGFQPWTAEYSNFEYSASNLTQGVYRFFSLLFAAYDFLADRLSNLGKGRSVEIVAVTDASPVLPAARIAEDRRAA